MKLTIDRKTLLEVLSHVQGVCSQKSTLPILSCCLLEAHEDGRLEIHGTDLDISVSTSCSADVEEGGKLALVAKRLFDTIKKLPSSEDIEITSDPNHWARVKTKSAKAKSINARLAGNHPDEFPAMPEQGSNAGLEIDSEVFLNMIKKVIFSVSTDETRASFMGAFLQLTEEGMLQMVSTDGHRLSKIECKIEGLDPSTAPKELLEGMIIPRKGLIELQRIAKENGNIFISAKGDDLLLSYERTRLAIRLIPGRFPNFSQVIPQHSANSISVPQKELVDALKRAADYAPKTGNTRLTVTNNLMEVHSFDPESGEFRESIECVYEGDEITAGYNYKYLLDVLKIIKDPNAIFEIINTDSPTVIRDPACDEALFIVMPMQF